jgi:HEAT repeat protein
MEPGDTTSLGRRPKGKMPAVASVAEALARGSVGGQSLSPPVTVSSVSGKTGFEAPERPRPANLAKARARAMSDLASSKAHYRYEGALAAGALRLEEGVGLLARLARGSDVSAAPAIGALGIIGGEDAARALAVAYARQRQTYVRIRIIRALGVTRAKRALKPLLRAFSSDLALVRIEAARALGNLGDTGAVSRLRASLAKGGAVTADKVAVASTLARLGDAGGMAVLERAISSRSPELGAIAINGLAAIAASAGRSGDDKAARLRSRAVQGIAVSLGSPYAAIWGAALRALARLRSGDAIRVLDALETAAPEVRLRARVAKAAFGGKGSREILASALAHPAFDIRAVAAEILGLLGDRAAVGVLVRSLNDPHKSVRVAAAWALGRIGDPAAASALELGRASDDRALSRACARALGTIRSREIGTAQGQSPPKPAADVPLKKSGLKLQKVMKGSGGKRFCVIREAGGKLVLLSRGEETSAGYRVERIVAGLRGGGTVFLSKGRDALTLRATPAPKSTTSKKTVHPRNIGIPGR